MKYLLALTSVLCVLALFVGCGTPALNTGSGDASSSTSTTTTSPASSSSEENQTGSTTVSPAPSQDDPAPPQDDPAPSTAASADLLTESEAKAVALKHAGVKESNVFDLQAELDRENGKLVYDISFETNEFEFDYDIDAQSGAVLQSEKERQDDRPSSKKSTTTAKSTTTVKTTKATAARITKEQAKAAALKHAGVKAADAFDIHVELDRENGVEIYEIDFETAEYEYDYHVLAKNGKVVKAEREKQDDRPSSKNTTKTTESTSSTKKVIGKTNAKAAAFQHAAVKDSQVFDLEIELDRDGKATVYEVTFETQTLEFEYEIDAYTGKVLSSHSEPRD